MQDYGLEPLQRARSNTWPLPRPDAEDGGPQLPDGDSPPQLLDNAIGGPSSSSSSSGGGLLPPQPQQQQQQQQQPQPQQQQQQVGGAMVAAIGPAKKTSSRRNAWGNQSYADLITQAISSVPEQRLTLSQIYEWMVQNVPYFKDKGDSNSSAGWKNSIRHNLSLHSRFEKIQNEGTGKSSWWQINHNASRTTGKSRRRATSMETPKFEKKRGRVKKVVEAIRNGLHPENTPSPSSSVSENSDMISVSPLRGFQFSPTLSDFRARASSNASSTGRLSPIFSEQLSTADYGLDSVAEQGQANQLAGTLAQTVRLSQPIQQQQTRPLESYEDVFLNNRPPPPPYCSLSIQSCPVHGYHGCSCFNLSQLNNSSYIKQDCISFENILDDPQDDNMSATVVGQIMGSSHLPYDELNINLDNFPPECNVDEVIKHEVSLGGCLDFNNFNPPIQPQPSVTTTQTLASVSHDQSSFTSGHHWVH